MKSKMRLLLSVGCLFAVLVIIYRTLGEASHPDQIFKPQPEAALTEDRKPRRMNHEIIEDKANAKKHAHLTESMLTNSKLSNSEKLNQVDEKPNFINSKLENNDNFIEVKEMKETKASPILPHVLVHLDLKGAPMLISYYEQIFPFFVKLGATGILIEYEDMFPYWGSLRDIPALNAYSQQDIQNIVRLAKKHGLELVPLVQTFGHLEFILKHTSLAHLREITAYPQVICPSQNDTFVLLTTMIDQVVALHPKSRWLHIGADEVYYLGQCSLCQQKIASMGWERDRLFLEHVKKIATYIKSTYGIQPIMWDDMFRQIPEEEIRASGISKFVEVMAWRYGRDILSELPHEVWLKYGNVFSGNIWIASAYKGATGPAQFLTLISYHLENHNSWLDIIKTYNSRLRFKGIAITGWSRFDHFAVLCELFAASLPSLAVNLLFLQSINTDPSLISKATRILDCVQPINLEFDVSSIVRCNYPGGRVYEGVQQLYNIHQEVLNMEASSYISGWLNQYNIDMRFSSPAMVEAANQKVQELKRNLTVLHDDMERALSAVYDRYTINEWFHLNLQELDKKADNWLNAIQDILSLSAWPRRPLTYNRTLSSSVSYRRDAL